MLLKMKLLPQYKYESHKLFTKKRKKYICFYGKICFQTKIYLIWQKINYKKILLVSLIKIMAKFVLT